MKRILGGYNRGDKKQRKARSWKGRIKRKVSGGKKTLQFTAFSATVQGAPEKRAEGETEKKPALRFQSKKKGKSLGGGKDEEQR